MDRDRGRCRFPHPHMTVACSAPFGMIHVDGRWQQNPANRGYLAVCHVIPRGLAGARRWDPHNLFVGCDAGNDWQEAHTAEALQLGVQAHEWEPVRNGRRAVTP